MKKIPCAVRMTRWKPVRAALVLGLLLAFPVLSCSMPGSVTPTPFVFTTPDLTLTAIFAPLLTLTPEPPQVHTATPVPALPSPSPFPTQPSSSTPLPTDTATPTPTSVAQKLRQAALVEATYLAQAPVLDGILDEWSLTSFQVRSVVYGLGNWQGEADTSATARVGWDSTYLYLAVQVRDDQYVQEASGINIFKGDSLEILLDADLDGDFEIEFLNDDDYQLGISPGSPYPGGEPEAYLWYPSSREGGRPEVKIAARGREGGYNVEVAVPWGLFGITPQAGAAYGFAFSVSDNDREGEQVQESMVSNLSTRKLADPTSWGSLVLIKP